MSELSFSIPDDVFQSGTATNTSGQAIEITPNSISIPNLSLTPPAPPASPAEPADPTESAKPEGGKALEDLLGALDEDARSIVLAQVAEARRQAANWRSKYREAEPWLAERERLEAASRTDLQRVEAERDQFRQQAEQARRSIAQARVEATLASIGVADAAGIAADLDMTKFIGDDGAIDEVALAGLRNRYASFGRRVPAPDATQASGANGAAPLTPAQEFAAFLGQQLAQA